MTDDCGDLEDTAKVLRKRIREKAGLRLDWDKANEDMRNWYREMARRIKHGESNIRN